MTLRPALLGVGTGAGVLAVLYLLVIYGGVVGVVLWLLLWVVVVLAGLAVASRRRSFGMGISAGAAVLLLGVTVVAAIAG